MIKNILYVVSLTVIYILLGIFTWGDHVLMTGLIFGFTFCLAFFIKKTKWIKTKTTFFYLLPGILIFSVFLITSIINTIQGFNSFMSTFTYLIFIPIFFYLGYLFYKTKNYIYLIVVFPILYLNHTYIYPNSFSYFSFNHLPINKQLPLVKFINKDKETFTLSKDKIVVLDFWSTSCGICYKKFPEFEKMYQQYKDNPNIEFYAIHVSYERDKFEKVIKLLDKYEYNFPLIYSIDSKSVEDKLEVRHFPTTILIKNSVIRYKGFLVTNKNVITGNTIRQLESLLNE